MRYTPRSEWGAKYGMGPRLKRRQVDLAVLHHSWRPDPPPWIAPEEEAVYMRSVERFHVTSGAIFTDKTPVSKRRIAYNWVAFPSGRIYEGIGWGRVGAHAAGVNSKSFGICLMMDGDAAPATPEAMEAVRSIIRTGIYLGHLSKSYALRPHSDFSSKSCPGRVVSMRLHEFRHDAGRRSPDEPPDPGALPVLRRGDTGTLVGTVQKLLGVEGPDRFGPLTEAAVKRFQTMHGLKPDGIVGPRTWSFLLKHKPPEG